MAYANLHLGLYLWDKDRYTVNLSFTRSGSDTDTRPEVVGLPMSNFARKRFLQCALDMEAYGTILGRSVLADPKLTKVTKQRYLTRLPHCVGHGRGVGPGPCDRCSGRAAR